MLTIGTKAPDFTLPDQNGNPVSLSEYRGKKVILYFYPRDNTPGCTKQACGFAELYPQFQQKNAVVIGINHNSVTSHKKFEEKYSLPFTLLSDKETNVLAEYGVWKEKKNVGKVTMGVVRTTYLIDEDGVIRAAMDKVKAEENPGGLVRAYGQAVKEGLAACETGIMRPGAEVLLETNYNDVGKILYLMGQKGLEALESEYGADVTLKILLPLEEKEAFCKELTEVTAGRVKLTLLRERTYVDKET